jgi:hypothetical protein
MIPAGLSLSFHGFSSVVAVTILGYLRALQRALITGSNLRIREY